MLVDFKQASYWCMEKGDFILNNNFRRNKILHYFNGNFYDQFNNILSYKMLENLCKSNELINNGWELYTTWDHVDRNKLYAYHRETPESFKKKQLCYLDCVKHYYMHYLPKINIVFIDVRTKIYEPTPVQKLLRLKSYYEYHINTGVFKYLYEIKKHQSNELKDTKFIFIRDKKESAKDSALIQLYLNKYHIEIFDTLYREDDDKEKEMTYDLIMNCIYRCGWFYQVNDYVIIDNHPYVTDISAKILTAEDRTITSSIISYKKHLGGLNYVQTRKAIQMLKTYFG